jgi:hypothetical protein
MLSAMVKIKRAHRLTLRPSFPAVPHDEHLIYTSHGVTKATEQSGRGDDVAYIYKRNFNLSQTFQQTCGGEKLQAVIATSS